ncbi:MAG: Na+/H+ antiporter subunit E [Trueperaceae bacterium]
MAEVLAIFAIALLWSALSGELTIATLVVGSAIGLVLLSVVERGRSNGFPGRLVALVRYLIRFAGELVVANVLIARLALQPRPRFHQHVIAVPLRLRSDVGINLLAATITLLPGTVAMGVSADRKTLYAHAIASADPDHARASVLRMEKLIMGFLS